MAIRLVNSLGNVTEPVMLNLPASGVIHNGVIVEWIRNGTGGALVGPAATAATSTQIFGVAVGPYVQGASDTFTNVIPFTADQLWEVDCANAVSTAQLGLRHSLSASRGYIHNTLTDYGATDAIATRVTGVFLALNIVGSTSGSGKLIGKFVPTHFPTQAASLV